MTKEKRRDQRDTISLLSAFISYKKGLSIRQEAEIARINKSALHLAV